MASLPSALRRSSRYPPPARRRLRVFSLDPTLSRLEGATAVLSLPWEPLKPGPVGDRIKVEDWDENLHRCPKVDLDDPHLLAQDGLAPDEHDRQLAPPLPESATQATPPDLTCTWRSESTANRSTPTSGSHRRA